MGFLELIDELYEYIENLPGLPLSSKSLVDKIEVIEILKEIRNNIPEEISKARWVLKERERILKDAEKEAQDILKDSKKQIEGLINENEIVRSAKIKAQETFEEIQNEKKAVNESIRGYADRMLEKLETDLEKYLLMIKENRREIEQGRK